MGLQDKFEALRHSLSQALVERDHVVDGLVCAALAGEHVLLLGPPGTAKSALARAFVGGVSGATGFEWLLNKFSAPEELFGPLDLQKLKAGSYQRVTTGKLPEADVAFLDEIFKANSGILNALLTAINERKFHDGAAPKAIPLRMVIGASNEMPEGPELAALYDRFLVRYWVDYVDSALAFSRVLLSAEPAAGAQITLGEWDQARAEVARVKLDEGVADAFWKLRGVLERSGVQASDRRWKRATKLVQASAWLDGESEIGDEHLAILEHALWTEPGQQEPVRDAVSKASATPAAKARDLRDQLFETIKGVPAMDPKTISEEQQRLLVATMRDSKRAKDQMRTLAGGSKRDRDARTIESYIRQVDDALAPIQAMAKNALGLG